MNRNKNRVFKSYDPSDFDTEHYEGMFILPKAKGSPVVIQRSKNADPPHWCIVHGYSSSVYYSYKEVLDYCLKQGWL